MGERKGERPGFERDRKKDMGGRKRETGIGEREPQRVNHRLREKERQGSESERKKRDKSGR